MAKVGLLLCFSLTRHPDSRMIGVWFFATFPEQVLDALVDVRHPLLLFGIGSRIDGKAFGRRPNDPAIFVLGIVVQRLQLYLLQRDDMLLVILLFRYHYVSVN